jgi:decaprenyl-phosphate phosphoribosyltransferase
VAQGVGPLTPATRPLPEVDVSVPPLLRLCRPKQWVKNLLVFAAPAAAGVLSLRDPDALLETVAAFVAFTLVASGTYCFNDVADREADRRHPTKRSRPVASGAVAVPTAVALGTVLLLAGVVLALLVHWQLGVVVAAYVVVTTGYSRWLRNVVLLDLVAIAAGFVLRALAGGAATGVPISDWFFIVTTFGSLFVAAGKRSGELADLDDLGQGVVPSRRKDDPPPAEPAVAPTGTRATLSVYTASYLAYLRATCGGVMLVAYCLWAFETAAEADLRVPLFQASIVPFALAVLQYAHILDGGGGGTPEQVFLKDRMLQLYGVLWAVVFGLGLALS